MTFFPGHWSSEGYLHKERPAEYFKIKLMLVMLCRIFRRCSDAVRTPCTHIQPSCPPASEEVFNLSGDKLSWQPCQPLWNTPRTQPLLSTYLAEDPTLCLLQVQKGIGVGGWGGPNMGLQSRRQQVWHLGHFQTKACSGLDLVWWLRFLKMAVRTSEELLS